MPQPSDNLNPRRAALLARVKGYDAKAGQTIVGKLMRGGDGKFSSGGTSTTDDKARKIIAEQAAKPKPPKAGGRRAKLKARKAPKAAKKTPKPKPTDAQKQQARDEKKARYLTEQDLLKAKNHDTIATALTGKLPSLDFANVMSFANGVDISPDKLQSALAQGLLEQGTDGTLRLSPAGRGLKQAADRGDIRQALDSLSRGHDAVAKRLATEARRAALLARRKPKNRQSTLDMVARRISRYKSLDGRPRWLSVTTTAFKDRQAEILSTASLEADVVRSYKAISDGKTTDHGPLLFWHTPIELGRCDWRAVSGHSLIESGYFHSEKEAKLVKPSDQMSPGFYHSIIDPDPSGIFNYIITEERSITPYRRAANPYTLITKEADMPGITPEKAQEYTERGGDPALLEELLTKQAETEAQLKGLGVAHKDDSAVVEVDDDEAEIAEPTGPMFLAEDFEIARPMFEEIITKALAPIVGMMDVQKTIAGHVQALQSGYAKKEAEQQTQAEQIAALIAQNQALELRVKELEGDIPEGVKRAPVRASEAINTLSGRTKEVTPAAGPMSDGGINFFNDVIPGMQGKVKQVDMLE